LPTLALVLLGLTLIGMGTFFAQATATGFVSRAAMGDHGEARGHLFRLLPPRRVP
jgi:hypothetical protein